MLNNPTDEVINRLQYGMFYLKVIPKLKKIVIKHEYLFFYLRKNLKRVIYCIIHYNNDYKAQKVQ